MDSVEKDQADIVDQTNEYMYKKLVCSIFLLSVYVPSYIMILSCSPLNTSTNLRACLTTTWVCFIEIDENWNPLEISTYEIMFALKTIFVNMSSSISNHF